MAAPQHSKKEEVDVLENVSCVTISQHKKLAPKVAITKR